MKRICNLLILLLCCTCLCLSAHAATGASSVRSSAAVSADGSCQISMTIVFRLEKALDGLTFPVPSGAKSITLNGTPANTRRSDSAVLVDIPLTTAGDYTMQLQYTLPDVVRYQRGKLILTLPLLSGFAYPISAMEFTVTLPGAITAIPSFSSGYHQENIESSLVSTVSGNTVSGFVQQTLKDHETLTMTLEVPEGMFPDSALDVPRFGLWDGGALILIVLAVLYYCLTLLPRLPKRIRCFTPPDGIGAGDVGTCLTGRGTDLTMMVMTWAQLGYILIELDDNGRVLLHKRMDMGNERSNFEVKCFKNLFGGRKTVDGTGYHYAQLYRKIAGKSPLLRQLYLRSSGNTKLFRILCCAAGAFSGVSMALACTDNVGLQTVLGIVFAAACAGTSWMIQSGVQSLPLRERMPLVIGIAVGLIWLAVGALAGSMALTAPVVLFQFLAGFAAAFGGRRSELGMRCLSQLLSLKKYMRTANAFDLQRLAQANPNYFYELAPYALAMGVEKPFARRFGKATLPECSFLVTDKRHQMTASEWVARLQEVADALGARQKRIPYERLFGK